MYTKKIVALRCISNRFRIESLTSKLEWNRSVRCQEIPTPTEPWELSKSCSCLSCRSRFYLYLQVVACRPSAGRWHLAGSSCEEDFHQWDQSGGPWRPWETGGCWGEYGTLPVGVSAASFPATWLDSIDRSISTVKCILWKHASDCTTASFGYRYFA